MMGNINLKNRKTVENENSLPLVSRRSSDKSTIVLARFLLGPILRGQRKKENNQPSERARKRKKKHENKRKTGNKKQLDQRERYWK